MKLFTSDENVQRLRNICNPLTVKKGDKLELPGVGDYLVLAKIEDKENRELAIKVTQTTVADGEPVMDADEFYLIY